MPFSCLEIFVFLAIISLLSAVVIVDVMGSSCQGCPRPKADLRAIGNALDVFKIDTGHYPERLDSLWVRPTDVRSWRGPYLKEYPPVDPWGAEYLYVRAGERNFEVFSFGADGRPGGVEEDADLSSRTINAAE